MFSERSILHIDKVWGATRTNRRSFPQLDLVDSVSLATHTHGKDKLVASVLCSCIITRYFMFTYF